ncbi:hypothetical protein DRE_02105 [Drechslerella stenobrocha 248]|uniref:Nephrocystin 3-like N-terminal domain-containing protein n=1 Tax=Drechslerella stenobrocha 248 TaxID=1043628 RepID=W7HVZ1_9PEZI|nr:hypothetical protein DRE_02105 [Drechslerella stenobrocha 248]
MEFAASVLGIIQIATEVGKICAKYAREVYGAREDAKTIQQHTDTLFKILTHTQKLLDGPYKSKLEASIDLGPALSSCESELTYLLQKLEIFSKATEEKSKGVKKLFQRIRKSDLKWPFAKKEVEGIVKRLATAERNIDRALQIDQVKVVLSVEQESYLAKLLIAEGAPFDSFEDQGEPECLPDTRVNLLKYINKWVEAPGEKQMFWLCGNAGTGKSTISRTVARTLRERGQLGASFFFKRGKANRGDASRFISTLAIDLRLHIPKLGPYISQAVEKDQSIGRQALRQQFQKLIFEPLGLIDKSDLPDPEKPVVIVIDALDECRNESAVKSIIELFSQLEKIVGIDIRTFITSRPEAQIKAGFCDSTGDHKDVILHNIQKNSIENDISVFLRHELYNITKRSRRLSADWPGESNIQTLTEITVPLFISAATLCRFVADRRFSPQERLAKVLELKNASFSSKLEETYLPIFDQVFVDGIEKTKYEEKVAVTKAFRESIGVLVMLETPLPLKALCRIIDKSDDEIEGWLDNFQSVINIPEDEQSPIQTYHLSFRDFLLSTDNNDQWFWIEPKDIHKIIATNCIKLMSETLRQNICSFKRPGIFNSEITLTDIEFNIPKDIQYACQYWIHHLKQSVGAGGLDHEMQDMLLDFLKRHLLHWLEIISLLGLSCDAIVLTRDLKSINLGSQDKSYLSDFVHDISRFVQYHNSIMSDAPLQVYTSALLWSPEKSLVRQQFSDTHLAKWVYAAPKVELNWDSKLQVIGENQYIGAVAFSSDGKSLASACHSTIRIRDSTTGALKQKLSVPNIHFSSAVFSPKDTILALASNSIIHIWDVASWTKIDAFSLAVTDYQCLKFSPDGSNIAGVEGNRVKIWSVEPLVPIQLFDYEDGESDTVGFDISQDWKIMASYGKKSGVKIWDVGSGALLQHLFKPTKETGARSVAEVKFSPDGHLLAFNKATVIELWRLNSKEAERIQSFETSFFCGMKFLSSSVLLRMEQHWQLSSFDIHSQTFTKTWTFERPISGFTLSPNQRVFATFDPRDNVTLWDMVSDSDTVKLPEPNYDEWLQASPDGRFLALGLSSNNFAIHLWPLGHTDGRKFRLIGHTTQTCGGAFSSDGGLLASAAPYSNQIIVWDTSTGEQLFSHYSQQEIFRDPIVDSYRTQVQDDGNKPWTLLAFSPNSKFLAAASNSGDVVIFDVHSRSEKPILEFKTLHNKPLRALAFSTDGKLLASVFVFTASLLKSDGEREYRSEQQVWVWSTDTWDQIQVIKTFDISDFIVMKHGPTSDIQTKEGLAVFNFSHCGVYYEKSTLSGIMENRGWVTRNGEETLLWVPPLDRGNTWYKQPREDILTFQHDGRICILRPSLSSST